MSVEKNNEEELSSTDLEKLVESLVLSKILSGDLETESDVDSDDVPELTEEQMNELLAKVRENFGGTNEKI
jgi:hypothetical protein